MLDIKFLFMDEKYPSLGDPRDFRITALTGVLVPIRLHSDFRDRFYNIVRLAIGVSDGSIPLMPKIHACNLFRDGPESVPDQVHFDFYRGIISIIHEYDLKIYRVGYYANEITRAMPFGDEKGIRGLCFMSMLFALRDELEKCAIWPVMETDRSNAQDRDFAGLIKNIDWLTAHKLEYLSVDNKNLGELLYSTKNFAYGSLVDCISYILYLRFKRNRGFCITPYQDTLADIADMLEPAIVCDEIIHLNSGSMPPSYRSNGPIRFAVPVAPRD